jgi:N-acetyl-alpha-D-muramate 1-phosphate uridylyltransferase
MKVMILAAGMGARLRPLTETTPKALIEVHGRPIITYHLERLEANGFHDIVINVSYLADKIKQYLGNGRAFGVNIVYSEEATPLETGGGILNALPLLGDQPFLAINADIVTDYPFEQLKTRLTRLVHCVLVENQWGKNDFGLQNHLLIDQPQGLMYSGIAVYSPTLFTHCQHGKFSVVPLLKQAIANQQVTGEIYTGVWRDIGTVTALNAFNLD